MKNQEEKNGPRENSRQNVNLSLKNFSQGVKVNEDKIKLILKPRNNSSTVYHDSLRIMKKIRLTQNNKE